MLLGRSWSVAVVVAGVVLIGTYGCGFVAERSPSTSTAPGTTAEPASTAQAGGPLSGQLGPMTIPAFRM